MFRLGFPERTGLSDLRHNPTGPASRRANIGDGLPGNSFLLTVCIEDGRAVAGAPVVALPVQRSRVMDLKEKLQQFSVAELLRIKYDLDRLRMAAVITIGCI